MAGKHWNDVNWVAMSLKAHRLAGLLSIDLEGNNRVAANPLIARGLAAAGAAWNSAGNGVGLGIALRNE